jgi:hypothetical protein
MNVKKPDSPAGKYFKRFLIFFAALVAVGFVIKTIAPNGSEGMDPDIKGLLAFNWWGPNGPDRVKTEL